MNKCHMHQRTPYKESLMLRCCNKLWWESWKHPERSDLVILIMCDKWCDPKAEKAPKQSGIGIKVFPWLWLVSQAQDTLLNIHQFLEKRWLSPCLLAVFVLKRWVPNIKSNLNGFAITHSLQTPLVLDNCSGWSIEEFSHNCWTR